MFRPLAWLRQLMRTLGTRRPSTKPYRRRLHVERLEDRINMSGDPTIVVADVFSVHHGQSLTAFPLMNDTDPENDNPLTPELDSSMPAMYGNAYFNPDGSLGYDSYGGYVGDETLSYRVFDGTSYSEYASITIHVTNSAPVAVSDVYSVHHGKTITKQPLSNDSDADAPLDTLTPELLDSAMQGMAYFIGNDFHYDSTDGWVGTEVLQYRLFDGAEYSAVKTITIHVTNTPPFAENDVYSVHHGKTITKQPLSNDSDADAPLDTLTPELLDSAMQGMAYFIGNDFHYDSTDGWVGTEVLRYRLFDGAQYSDEKTITIHVTNDPPVAEADVYNIHQGKNLTAFPLTNDTNTDGDNLTPDITDTTDAHGTAYFAGGAFHYTSDPDFFGTATVYYRLFDGAEFSDPVAITIHVSNIATWTGAGGDNIWENPANWDQDVIPTASLNADLTAATAPIVNQTGAITALSLGVSPVGLQINGSFTVGSGTITGQLAVAGALTLNPGATLTLLGGLDLGGQLHLGSSSEIILSNTSQIYGAAPAIDGEGKIVVDAATLSILSDVAITNLDLIDGAIEGSAALMISGTLNASGGTSEAPLSIGAALNSTGIVDVQVGSLSLGGGGSLGGEIKIADASELILYAGEFISAQPTFEPSQPSGQIGRLIVGSGVDGLGLANLTINDGETFNVYNILVRGGGILNDGTIILNGQSEWRSDALTQATGAIRNVGTLRITVATLRLADFVNQGTAFWTPNIGQSEGTLSVWNSSNSGNFIITAAASQSLKLRTRAATFYNNGQMTVNGSGSLDIVSTTPFFRNNGSIAVQQGSQLNVVTGFDNQGNGFINADAGTSVNLSRSVSFGDATAPGHSHALRGQGMFNIGTGLIPTVVVIALGVEVEVDRLTLGASATTFILGTLHPHALTLSGGSLVGTDSTNPINTGMILLNISDTINLTGNFSASNVIFENDGTILWQPGCQTITMGPGAAFLNDGLFEVLTSTGALIEPLANTGQAGEFVISNNGTLRKLNEDTSESAVTRIEVPVVNNGGTVMADSRLWFKAFKQMGPAASLQCTGPGVVIDGLFDIQDGTTNVDFFQSTSARFAGGIANIGYFQSVSAVFTGTSTSFVSGSVSNLMTISSFTLPALAVGAQVHLNGTLSVKPGGDPAVLALDVDTGTSLFLHGFSVTSARIVFDGTIDTQGGAINAGRLQQRPNGRIIRPANINANLDIQASATFQLSEVTEIGLVTINGDLTLAAGSTSLFRISGISNDQAIVNGHAKLAGEIQADFTATDFVEDAEYVVMTFDSYEGLFDNVIIALNESYYLDVVINADSIVLVMRAYV